MLETITSGKQNLIHLHPPCLCEVESARVAVEEKKQCLGLRIHFRRSHITKSQAYRAAPHLNLFLSLFQTHIQYTHTHTHTDTIFLRHDFVQLLLLLWCIFSSSSAVQSSDPLGTPRGSSSERRMT